MCLRHASAAGTTVSAFVCRDAESGRFTSCIQCSMRSRLVVWCRGMPSDHGSWEVQLRAYRFTGLAATAWQELPYCESATLTCDRHEFHVGSRVIAREMHLLHLPTLPAPADTPCVVRVFYRPQEGGDLVDSGTVFAVLDRRQYEQVKALTTSQPSPGRQPAATTTAATTAAAAAAPGPAGKPAAAPAPTACAAVAGLRRGVADDAADQIEDDGGEDDPDAERRSVESCTTSESAAASSSAAIVSATAGGSPCSVRSVSEAGAVE